MKLVIIVEDAMKQRAEALIKDSGMNLEGFAGKAFRKAVADGELFAFQQVKKAEIEAKARQLNEELNA